MVSFSGKDGNGMKKYLKHFWRKHFKQFIGFGGITISAQIRDYEEGHLLHNLSF